MDQNLDEGKTKVASPAPAAQEAGHLTGWGKFRRVLQIVNVRLRFILLMVIVGLVAGNWETILNYKDRWARQYLPAAWTGANDLAATGAAASHVEYYCPMHPQIVTDSPGKCPICGMPLAKREKSTGPTSMPEGVLAQVQLTPLKVALGRIATTQVEYRLLGRQVRTVGQIDYDETRRALITSRIKGRLDKLLVNFTGQKVVKGDPLAEIYSPDLLVAQEELLLAAKSAGQSPPGPNPPGHPPAFSPGASLLEAARKKLMLWGITEQQITDIIKQGQTQDRLVIYSPMTGIVTEKKVLQGQAVMDGQELYTIADLGRVWMQADIYEADLAGIRQGLTVAVSADAYPNESFPGNITFIAYQVDPATRTIKARIEISNPEYKLKPGMNVVATIGVPIGAEPVEVAPTSQPEAAAVDMHEITMAYLALSAALAADKVDAAAATAEKLATEAEGLTERLPAVKPVAAQARELAGQKDPTGQRDRFRTISEELITLLRTHPPEGMTLYLLNCPMAGTGGNWVTAKNEIVNPYQGSGMLTCSSGPPVLMKPEPASPGRPIGVRISSDGRFAFGYYCPVRPDRLFDRPEQCPLDNFPFKYMKVERVLAVPESAVIDTGERQVVYRETAPGAFDLVQVKLDQRAGEFYPVLDGLRPGDRVVTYGAFAVDAENRLNPAAAAQYFGAGSGDKPAGGHKH